MARHCFDLDQLFGMQKKIGAIAFGSFAFFGSRSDLNEAIAE